MDFEFKHWHFVGCPSRPTLKKSVEIAWQCGTLCTKTRDVIISQSKPLMISSHSTFGENGQKSSDI